MKRLLGIVFLLFLYSSLLVTVPASGQESVGLADTPWPMYQHDAQHTGRSPFVGIMHQPVLLWKESLGLSQDMGGIIIDQDGSLLIADGMKLTRYDPIQRQPIWQYLYTHSRSIPLLASDGYMYLGKWNEFFQLTPDGQLGWIVLLDANLVFGSSASFGLDGNIYFGHDALWSFTQKGDLSWVYPFDDFSHVSPAVGLDGMIYAGGGAIYDICAWRPNGAQYWCLDTPHHAEDASPSIAANGNIILASDEGSLYSIRPSGQIDWEFETEWAGTNAPSIEAAIGPDESIYFTINTNESLDGYLYAVDRDGNFKWRTTIPYNSKSNQGPRFYRPPITDRQGNVYICAGNMRCYGFDADGSELWQFEYPIEDSIVIYAGMAPLIAGDGLMYIMDNHNFLSAYADPEIYPLLFTDVQVIERNVEFGAPPFTASLPVNSTILPINYSASVTNVPWLSIRSASGVTPEDLVLEFDPSTIAVPGIYRAEVQIRAQNQVGWTIVIPVELNVGVAKTFLPMINKDTGHYQLVYFSRWYRESQLVTNEIDGLNRQSVVSELPWNMYGAFYTADARCVALVYFSESSPGLVQLRTIDTFTGQTVYEVNDIKQGPGGFSWDPGGQRLVVALYRDDPLHSDVYIVEPNGVLTRLTSNPYNDLYPLWSPTGEWIAFTNNDVISLIRPNGSDMHALQIDFVREYPVAWSNDGRILYFYVQPQLWAYDIQTGESWLVVEGLTAMVDSLPIVSPDGAQIVFFDPVEYPNREVKVITLDGGVIVTISPEPGDYKNLSWSPDSHWVAYDRFYHRTDFGVDDFDVHIVRRDGTSHQILTSNIDWDRYAAWRR